MPRLLLTAAAADGAVIGRGGIRAVGAVPGAPPPPHTTLLLAPLFIFIGVGTGSGKEARIAGD